MLFYIKHSKLFSESGGLQKGWPWLPRSWGLGRPRSGPDLICIQRN